MEIIPMNSPRKLFQFTVSSQAGHAPNAGRRGRTAMVLALMASVGVAMLAFAPSTAPVVAQESSSVQTPYGRAPITFADIVDRVKPAVVSISVRNVSQRTARDGQKRGERGPDALPELPEPFNEWFKNWPKEFRGPTPRPQQGQGSGFVISADGYVVTNNHVIDGSNQVTVSFDAQQKYEATVVGSDSR